MDSIKTGVTSGINNLLYKLPQLGANYFKINTMSFKSRFIQGLKPYKNQLYLEIGENPDFYGPFWIYTTVVFCLSSSGVTYQFINGVELGKEKTSFAQFVSTSFLWIYLIGFIFPGILTIMLKYSGGSVDYAKAMCIYGYTFSIFIPISVICIFFNSYIDWVLLFYAGISSTFILMKCFYQYFPSDSNSINSVKKYGILGTISIFQFLLILFMSIYFFSGKNLEKNKLQNVNSNNSMMLNSNELMQHSDMKFSDNKLNIDSSNESTINLDKLSDLKNSNNKLVENKNQNEIKNNNSALETISSDISENKTNGN